jgi:hypothetical protein
VTVVPLQDHFHPPLSLRRHWHSFHNSWATYLSSDLNRQLPPGYFAEPNVQFGIEIDVATYDEGRAGDAPASVWAPPEAPISVPIALVTDVVEVRVFDAEGGPTLAGAIELVSPANKDRASHRDAFVSKCAAYVQQGIGLVVVDVVTDRRGNLHDELLARLQAGAGGATGADLYAVAYRPVGRDGEGRLEVWPETLAVGQSLPTLPLCLRGGPSLRVDLEATYERTRQELRVGLNGA